MEQPRIWHSSKVQCLSQKWPLHSMSNISACDLCRLQSKLFFNYDAWVTHRILIADLKSSGLSLTTLILSRSIKFTKIYCSITSYSERQWDFNLGANFLENHIRSAYKYSYPDNLQYDTQTNINPRAPVRCSILRSDAHDDGAHDILYEYSHPMLWNKSNLQTVRRLRGIGCSKPHHDHAEMVWSHETCNGYEFHVRVGGGWMALGGGSHPWPLVYLYQRRRCNSGVFSAEWTPDSLPPCLRFDSIKSSPRAPYVDDQGRWKSGENPQGNGRRLLVKVRELQRATETCTISAMLRRVLFSSYIRAGSDASLFLVISTCFLESACAPMITQANSHASSPADKLNSFQTPDRIPQQQMSVMRSTQEPD